MTKNKICQNIFNIQRQFFESKKTINPKERIKSLKKLKSVISKNEEKYSENVPKGQTIIKMCVIVFSIFKFF